MKLKMVHIKLDPKKKCRSAFYLLSIERVIMDVLEVDNYFDMRISNGEIEIFSDNEEIFKYSKRRKRLKTWEALQEYKSHKASEFFFKR